MVGTSGKTIEAAERRPRGPARLPWLFACLVVFVLAGLRISVSPTWSWDLIAYVGCVNEARGLSTDEIHVETLAELQRTASPQIIERLTLGDSDAGGQRGYRRAVSQSASAFEAQLGFYRGRWLYIRLLDQLSKTGLPAMQVAFGLSQAAGAALTVLLMAWLARFMPALAATGLAWLGMEFANGFQTAANASPDSLATLLLVAGAFALIEARNNWVAGALMLAALATRVDHAVLLLPLLLWSATVGFGKGRQLSGRSIGLLLVLMAGVIYGCTLALNTYDWWTVHSHTFQGYMAFPADQAPPRDLAAGLFYSLRSLPKFAGGQGLFFCLVPTLGIWLARRRAPSQPICGLCVVALVGILAHFALFPVLWPRLMGPYWLLAWVGFASHLWRREPPVSGAKPA